MRLKTELMDVERYLQTDDRLMLIIGAASSTAISAC
jgi:hypothetical protein